MALKRQPLSSAFSELWLRRRQLAGDYFINETHAVVAAIAERLISGVPAPAKRDHATAREAERLTRGIANFKFALDADRAVGQGSNFSRRHAPW